MKWQKKSKEKNVEKEKSRGKINLKVYKKKKNLLSRKRKI